MHMNLKMILENIFSYRKSIYIILSYIYIEIHMKQYIILNTFLNNDQINGICEVCKSNISKSSLK